MNIEKIKQALEIVKLLDCDSTEQTGKEEFAIVVADRGFVYVGDVTETPTHCFIKNAYNIRIWGTTKGLGELILEGAKPNTKLDACGNLRLPMRAVISIHETKKSVWKLS